MLKSGGFKMPLSVPHMNKFTMSHTANQNIVGHTKNVDATCATIGNATHQTKSTLMTPNGDQSIAQRSVAEKVSGFNGLKNQKFGISDTPSNINLSSSQKIGNAQGSFFTSLIP